MNSVIISRGHTPRQVAFILVGVAIISDALAVPPAAQRLLCGGGSGADSRPKHYMYGGPGVAVDTPPRESIAVEHDVIVSPSIFIAARRGEPRTPLAERLPAPREVAYIIKTSAKNGTVEAQESPLSGKIAPRYEQGWFPLEGQVNILAARSLHSRQESQKCYN